MFQELMEKRRSIRKYKEERVSREELERVAESVFYAPTAMGLDTVRVIAVTNPDKLKEIGGFRKGAMTQFSTATAALAILSDREMSPSTHRQDACIAATYALLQAADLGLGACWVNVGSNQEAAQNIRQILDVPEKYGVECVIALGYPAEDPGKKQPKDPNIRIQWVE